MVPMLPDQTYRRVVVAFAHPFWESRWVDEVWPWIPQEDLR